MKVTNLFEGQSQGQRPVLKASGEGQKDIQNFFSFA